MFVAMIVVTQTSLPVIKVETSLVVLPSHLPVVARKLLISVTTSPLYTLYILIVRHDEVTEPPRVSALHQSRAAAGLEALKNIPSSSDLTRACPATPPHTGNTSETLPVLQ